MVLQELVPHLEKVQVHTGLQNHPGVFLAIKNAFEPIDLEKGTHGEFLFYLKSMARIPFFRCNSRTGRDCRLTGWRPVE